MRLRPEEYERIRQEAERDGRSISAQAEQRVLREDVGDVGRMVGAAIATLERQWGAAWNTSDEMRERCRIAADVVLNILLGPAPSVDDLLNRAQTDIRHRDQADRRSGSGILETLIASYAPSQDDLTKSLDRIQGLIDAHKAGSCAAGSDAS